MIFTIITFATAFSIEALATLISVIGLSTFFGANPIIIAIAVALDIGKLVVVSLLYTYWSQLTRLMKTYAIMATVVTMLITSGGAAGYLTAEFQKAIVGAQEISLRVAALEEERTKLEERKKQIDSQIANLPQNYSRSRIALMREFEGEQKQVTDRLTELDKQLPELKVQQLSTEAKAGPIVAISKAFGVPVERAAKWVIGLIIFVFDPLAVFLVLAGNFLLGLQRRQNQSDDVVNPPVKLAIDEKPIEKQVDNDGKKLTASERSANEKSEEKAETAEREVITMSSLGAIKPDPHTKIEISPTRETGEVGIGTGVYKTGYGPQRR